MAGKKKRIDVTADRKPLSDSPFGALQGMKGELPAPKAVIVPENVLPFSVAKTRKGGWPLSFEKRSGGKVATIISNVSGDGEALVKALRKLCATGGVFKENAVELQGDHRNRIETYLNKHLR